MSYLLRGIDPTLWRLVKTKAAREGVTIRQIILDALMRYAHPRKTP